MNSQKRFFVILSLVVTASVLYAFTLGGSPIEAKNEAFDKQKTTDIRNLQSAISTYYTQNSKLPNSLDELINSNNAYASLIKNDISQYKYTIIGKSDVLSDQFIAYNICATFLTENADKEYYGLGGLIAENTNTLGIHSVGENCYQGSVRKNPDRINDLLKDEQADIKTVGDLSILNLLINTHYGKNGKLPQSLKELGSVYGNIDISKYSYSAKTNTTYSICGTFLTDNLPPANFRNETDSQNLNIHPQGTYCYTFDLENTPQN